MALFNSSSFTSFQVHHFSNMKFSEPNSSAGEEDDEENIYEPVNINYEEWPYLIKQELIESLCFPSRLTYPTRNCHVASAPAGEEFTQVRRIY